MDLLRHSSPTFHDVLALCTVSLAHLNSSVTESMMELDSHADTCVVGKHTLILCNHDHPIIVMGYDSGLGKNQFTVDAVLTYDDHFTGEVIMLVHIPQLQHNLLCPMQL